MTPTKPYKWARSAARKSCQYPKGCSRCLIMAKHITAEFDKLGLVEAAKDIQEYGVIPQWKTSRAVEIVETFNATLTRATEVDDE